MYVCFFSYLCLCLCLFSFLFIADLFILFISFCLFLVLIEETKSSFPDLMGPLVYERDGYMSAVLKHVPGKTTLGKAK
jgi:hypothetical protein